MLDQQEIIMGKVRDLKRFEIRRTAFHPEGHIGLAIGTSDTQSILGIVNGNGVSHTEQRRQQINDMKIGGEAPINRNYYAKRIA